MWLNFLVLNAVSSFGTIELCEFFQAQHRQAVGVERLIQMLVLGQTGCSGCGWKVPLEVCGDTELKVVLLRAGVVGIAV
jgi:hypothetical protein